MDDIRMGTWVIAVCYLLSLVILSVIFVASWIVFSILSLVFHWTRFFRYNNPFSVTYKFSLHPMFFLVFGVFLALVLDPAIVVILSLVIMSAISSSDKEVTYFVFTSSS